MYGKHFAQMYTGSMVGRGALFFAVWGYVISHFRADKQHGAIVELNPKILATILGEPEEAIKGVLDQMCNPDPESRTPEEEGRKLIKVGAFSYQVVNGAKYRAIRDEEARRAANCIAKRRERSRKNGVSGEYKEREGRFVRAVTSGDETAADNIAAEGL